MPSSYPTPSLSSTSATAELFVRVHQLELIHYLAVSWLWPHHRLVGRVSTIEVAQTRDVLSGVFHVAIIRTERFVESPKAVISLLLKSRYICLGSIFSIRDRTVTERSTLTCISSSVLPRYDPGGQVKYSDLSSTWIVKEKGYETAGIRRERVWVSSMVCTCRER